MRSIVASKTTALLVATAAIEFATGVGLLVAPSSVVELLLGQPLSSGVPLVVGRVAGIALVAIGLICWLENMSKRAESPTGLLIGLLVYNSAVALLLVHSYIASAVSGVGLWPAVVLHLAFALWIAACLRSYSAARGLPAR